MPLAVRLFYRLAEELRAWASTWSGRLALSFAVVGAVLGLVTGGMGLALLGTAIGLKGWAAMGVLFGLVGNFIGSFKRDRA